MNDEDSSSSRDYHAEVLSAWACAAVFFAALAMFSVIQEALPDRLDPISETLVPLVSGQQSARRWDFGREWATGFPSQRAELTETQAYESRLGSRDALR